MHVHETTAAAPAPEGGVLVTDLSPRGVGIGRLADGRVCFAPGALPGDTVRVQERHRGQRSTTVQVLELQEPSPDRRDAPCALAGRCGGCQLQALTDGAQRSWKQRHVRETLRRIGGISIPLPMLVSDERSLGYRNKAVIPLARGGKGLVMGFYAPDSHRVVPLQHCPVLDPRLDALLPGLLADINGSSWPVYNEASGKGALRHLALRVGANSGEVLLTIVSRDRQLTDIHALARHWMTEIPGLVGVCLNVQPERSNRVFGRQTLCIEGRDWLIEHFAGLRLQIGPDTFFQANTSVAEMLLPHLRAAFAGTEQHLLIDAYCGIGTLTLPLAASAPLLLGIERHRGSIREARNSARINGLSHVRFEAEDVSAALPARLGDCTGLLLDPPRKGLDADLCRAIGEQAPQRLAYLSCSPASLARDLRLLLEPGHYKLDGVICFDFFPQTGHVETLAVLSRAGGPRAVLPVPRAA